MNCSPPKILLIGKNGQVGWELQRTLMPLGEVVALGRTEIDLCNNDSIRQAIRVYRPDVIVNAAAYTAVDKAEEVQALAMQVNGIAAGVMAEEARRINALLIHYSTDYVFDGESKTPYSENDTPNPVNYYGKSKLSGETAIQTVKPDYVILRTSWVYGMRGSNFVLTMLRLMKEREILSVVSDQHGAPTWSCLIAESTAHILKQSVLERRQGIFKSDLYHLTSSGDTTWHVFALAIREMAKQNNVELVVKDIEAITTDRYPTPAKRPKYSCLSLSKLENKYGLLMPHWQDCLKMSSNYT